MGNYTFNTDIVAARAAIARIRGLDLEVTSIEELKAALSPIFRGYRVHAPRFDPGLRLFRARRIPKPTNIRDLLYPMPGVAPMGRANRDGASMLYCCGAREATLFEIRPSIGDEIVIAAWDTTAKLPTNHCGYTESVFEGLGSNRLDGRRGPYMPPAPPGTRGQFRLANELE